MWMLWSSQSLFDNLSKLAYAVQTLMSIVYQIYIGLVVSGVKLYSLTHSLIGMSIRGKM